MNRIQMTQSCLKLRDGAVGRNEGWRHDNSTSRSVRYIYLGTSHSKAGYTMDRAIHRVTIFSTAAKKHKKQ